MISMKSASDYLYPAMTMYMHPYEDTWYIRHEFKCNDEYCYQKYILFQHDMNYSELLTIVDQLFNNIYDHGNGD